MLASSLFYHSLRFRSRHHDVATIVLPVAVCTPKLRFMHGLINYIDDNPFLKHFLVPLESLCYVPAAAGLSAIADVPAVANAILLLLMSMLLVASILN